MIETAKIYQLPRKVMSRDDYLVQQVRSKIIVHCGCVGQGNILSLHNKLKASAKLVYGVDNQPPPCFISQFHPCDITTDAFGSLLFSLPDSELVLLPDTLEHLVNPGSFIQQVAKSKKPLIITVPNATRFRNFKRVFRHQEQVNATHFAWYSYATVKNLIEEYDYRITDAVMTGSGLFRKLFPGVCGGIAVQCEPVKT